MLQYYYYYNPSTALLAVTTTLTSSLATGITQVRGVDLLDQQLLATRARRDFGKRDLCMVGGSEGVRLLGKVKWLGVGRVGRVE